MTISLLYWVIVALGSTAVYQFLALGRHAAPVGVRPPVTALITLVVFENIYYGLGRAWPDLYVDLYLYLPVVLAFKAGYVAALAHLNLRLSKPPTDTNAPLI